MKTVNLTIALALAAWLPASQVHAISWSEGCSFAAEEEYKAFKAKHKKSAQVQAVQTTFGESSKEGGASGALPNGKSVGQAKKALRKAERELKLVSKDIQNREGHVKGLQEEAAYLPGNSSDLQTNRKTVVKLMIELNTLYEKKSSLEQTIQEQKTIIAAAKTRGATRAVVPRFKKIQRSESRVVDADCTGPNRGAGVASGSDESTSSKDNSSSNSSSSGFSSFHPDECRTGR